MADQANLKMADQANLIVLIGVTVLTGVTLEILEILLRICKMLGEARNRKPPSWPAKTAMRARD